MDKTNSNEEFSTDFFEIYPKAMKLEYQYETLILNGNFEKAAKLGKQLTRMWRKFGKR